jgi:hypothetical protein
MPRKLKLLLSAYLNLVVPSGFSPFFLNAKPLPDLAFHTYSKYRSSNPSAVDDPNSIINACGPEGEEIREKR